MQGETKFTPGPWEAGDDEEYDLIIGNPNESDCLLEGFLVGRSDERRAANARLIAAAPDLYEALNEVVATSPIEDSTLPKVLAALAKARGEA